MVQAVSPAVVVIINPRTVTRDELRHLYNPLCESGYRNVYFDKKDQYGNKVWQAHIKLRVRGEFVVPIETPDGTTYRRVRVRCMKYRIPGSRSVNPAECARYVVAWYKQRYGERWELMLRRLRRRDHGLPVA